MLAPHHPDLNPTETPSTTMHDMEYSTPSTPDHDGDAPILETPHFVQPEYEEPLYTEINIPLPPIPSQIPSQTALQESNTPDPAAPTTPKRRSRARTLSSLMPFGRSRSTNGEKTRYSEEWPRVRREVIKNREVATAMDLNHQSKRTTSGIIDALAVVPAVLVLSAELFTPGSGDKRKGNRKDSGVGRWEDGIR